MNTEMCYLYRDAGNFKTFNEVVLRGEMSEADLARILDSLRDHELFIPDQIGLPEDRGEFDIDDELDHCWFELHKQDFMPTAEEPTVDLSTRELADRFERAAAEGWKDAEAWDRLFGGHMSPDRALSVMQGALGQPEGPER